MKRLPKTAAIRLEAMALSIPDWPEHPNRVPFHGVLTRVDTVSDRAPSGAAGHRVLLSRAVAEGALEVANLNVQKWHAKDAIDFSASLDFASISAQTCAELTISASGAAADNPVAPSWPAALEAGLSGIMYVSSGNTVTVRLCNPTTAAIDPASRTFAGRIIK